MTDKKFTDEEIIKRLEQCVKRGNRNYDTDIVLDLINRQKSEIERLQKEVNLVSILFQDVQERAEEYKLKIENLQNVISNQPIEISAKIEEQIKAEAYKEFAERLKKRQELFNYLGFDKIEKCAVEAVIDNLLEEMIEET